MKIFLKSASLFLLSVLLSCEKQLDNPEVDLYIEKLLAGSYTESDLPAFSSSDIPALLKYRNETEIITNFPHNGISSFWGPECRLGMFILWTIESVRAVETDSKYLIGRFPSQNPILAFRDSHELKLVTDDKSHHEAAEAYYNWWYSIYLFKDKMNIDPLKKTDYRWH